MPRAKGERKHSKKAASAVSASTHATATPGPPQGTADPELDRDTDPATLLQRLIKRQSFAGSWTREDLPCSAMHVSRDAVKASAEKLAATHPAIGGDKIAAVLATAIVIMFLEKKMADEEETWELVVEKARGWLAGEVGDEEVLKEVWKEADDIVGAAA
ncbi:hypothetical protein BDV95DRAFT_582412 [Massariosphaeria phaeospora]|uniref:Uncharacterized protein n=1 Tax=Massariosphaeria phaeospora TaxID=100035 RepID=A0A7C8I3K5_9PLEO|nr:hypothetical protein BDV95DRAFT_582412 [Massariosphaeria phaeospora]